MPVHERFTSLKDQKPVETTEVPSSPSVIQSSNAPVTVIKNELSEEERKVFDEERSKLYTQLDERVCFTFSSFIQLRSLRFHYFLHCLCLEKHHFVFLVKEQSKRNCISVCLDDGTSW